MHATFFYFSYRYGTTVENNLYLKYHVSDKSKNIIRIAMTQLGAIDKNKYLLVIYSTCSEGYC